jgi:hypothetical protein
MPKIYQQSSGGGTAPEPVECSKSVLTQEKFLDMLHTIVLHGDLTDVAFIEKTLQMKLKLQDIPTGAPLVDSNPDSRVYITESLLKTWINVVLRTSFNSSDYNSGKEPAHANEGSIEFSNLTKAFSDFRNCGYLKKDQLNQEFGQGFAEDNDPSHQTGACKDLGKMSKYAPITISYEFNNDGAIKDLTISQFTTGVDSPLCKRSVP